MQKEEKEKRHPDGSEGNMFTITTDAAACRIGSAFFPLTYYTDAFRLWAQM
jgi:hypothetical protein